MLNEFNKDQNVFPSGVVSMDVEEAKISRFDELIMLGKAQCGSGVKMAERKLAEQDDRLPALSFERDRWRQIPVRLMVGNGITWVLQIVLDCDVKNGRYEIKKQTASESVLNLIKSIPVCTGLGIKSDVEEVEQFYSELRGQQIKMKRWIDLGPMAVIAGYRL